MGDATAARFDPDALGARLPAGAVRYLTHAIRPGAPIPRTAEIAFSGQLRMRPRGPWLPFRARETLMAASGWVFSARARLGFLPVTTLDRYQAGHADSRIRLLGVLPIVRRCGPDADRAMRSRLVVESVWLPSAFLPDTGAVWSEEDGRLRLTLPVYGETVPASLRIEPGGELRTCAWTAGATSPTTAPTPGFPLRAASRPSDPLATTPSPRGSGPPGGRGPTASSSSSLRPSSRPPSCPNTPQPGPVI
jgi:hypothetical protein